MPRMGQTLQQNKDDVPHAPLQAQGRLVTSRKTLGEVSERKAPTDLDLAK
jgi:hypothetical protein